MARIIGFVSVVFLFFSCGQQEKEIVVDKEVEVVKETEYVSEFSKAYLKYIYSILNSRFYPIYHFSL